MPDWDAMFSPSVELTEVVLRASIMYLFLFFALRFLLKREGGQVNIADLLVVVAIVDGAQPAFNGEADSITESALFVVTVIFWSWLLNWLSWRFAALKWLTAAKPVVLIENGRFCRANMRRALMTTEELMQQLREEGVEDVGQVRHAMMEGDGEVSVVKYEDA
ncbi:DUF421 domain-containing protein [Sphingomonas rubra]|uniref:YetF C-terminal domain-containing protein n=1 Tax=Sphingomonas rubra TaxID=634430 RepID=A0A1I5UBL8_9SPHN|nr:YetF domain-containing protein [Sphingomonas rubra]SFP92347.1 Protein of unknown function [Sphingomonas rubra]